MKDIERVGFFIATIWIAVFSPLFIILEGIEIGYIEATKKMMRELKWGFTGK